MNAVAALLVASVGTFVIRYTSVRVLADRHLPASTSSVLRHAALAVMAGLVTSSTPTGALRLPTVAAAAALVVAAAVARRTANVPLAIAIGVAASALVTAIGA